MKFSKTNVQHNSSNTKIKDCKYSSDVSLCFANYDCIYLTCYSPKYYDVRLVENNLQIFYNSTWTSYCSSIYFLLKKFLSI